MREYSPYAFTQLRALLKRIQLLEIERERIDNEKWKCIKEAKIIGFPWTMTKTLVRYLRKTASGEPPTSDGELVRLWWRLANELEGPNRETVVSQVSAMIDSMEADRDEALRPQ